MLAGVVFAALYMLGKAVATNTFGARRRCWKFRFHGSRILSEIDAHEIIPPILIIAGFLHMRPRR